MAYDFPNIANALTRVDELRAEIDAMRPIDAERMGRAMQRLRLEWTYHSNAIEGNSLTYGETVALLMEGVTAQGKPLKDALDIQRHGEVLTYLEGMVQGKEELMLTDIRGLHQMLMGDTYTVTVQRPDGTRSEREERGGEFKQHPNSVLTPTGETHYYVTPEETPARMQDLVDWYRETWPNVENGTVLAIPFVADFHHQFVQIHPFPDTNGRTGRILMNLLLMKCGYIPAVLRQERRREYYGALSEADAGDLEPLAGFLAEELATTMELFLSAVRGESDPTAFDKRVALLKQRIETTGGEVPERTESQLHTICQHFVVPYLGRLEEGLERIAPLFKDVHFSCSLNHTSQVVVSDGLDILVDQLFDRDWFMFRAQWTLNKYKRDPKYSTNVIVDGNADTYFFELSSGGAGQRSVPPIRFSYNAPKNSIDARSAADARLEALMDAVEEVQRELENESSD